jgi:hypothetical protein
MVRHLDRKRWNKKTDAPDVADAAIEKKDFKREDLQLPV